MKVLTKIDTPARPDKRVDAAGFRNGGGTTPSATPKISDSMPYFHITTQRAAAAAIKSGAKTLATVVMEAASGGGGKTAAITTFEHTMNAIAQSRSGEKIRGPDGVIVAGTSLRGLRRDKRERSAAAESLLDMNDPPREMKIGLGWACLHVDLAVYTEDKAMTENKRVAGHIQWCDFWSTYQVCCCQEKGAGRGGSFFLPCDSLFNVLCRSSLWRFGHCVAVGILLCLCRR